MPEEKTDQAPVQKPEQSKSLSELFDEGWNKHEEEMRVVAEEKQKKTAQPTAKTFKHKSCAECPEEDAVPYRVLKVDGQEIPVWTEDELIALAQKGDSYTRKTQKLAEDRRSTEGEYQQKVSDIEKFLQNFNQMFDQRTKGTTQELKQQNVIPQKQTTEEIRQNVYEEFDIEPEYAEPYQKKLVDNIVKLREKISSQDSTIKEFGDFVKMSKIERGIARLSQHITAAREKYPIEVYTAEDGTNLTAKQLVEVIDQKANLPENKNRDIGEVAEEAVKEVHLMQKKIQESVPVTNKMTATELKAKFPELYESIVKDASQAAVVQHEREKSELPPSIPKKEATVDIEELKKARRDSSGKSLSEQLDDAFQDPEILGALGIGK